MLRSLVGLPRLVREKDHVAWWDVKGTTVGLTSVALVALICALLADGRHHRAVLRCSRHEGTSPEEDNDCVLTENPRGIDRLFEKRRRSSFEIAGADLELEVPALLRRSTTALTFSNSSLAFQNFYGRRLRGAVASVIVTDELGRRRVVHRFDDPTRAAAALGAVEAYLSAAKMTPASLALRYDDSTGDELIVLFCAFLLLAWAWRPVFERVDIDTETELIKVRRRNVFGARVFDFAAALENVSAIALAEYKDGFGLRIVLTSSLCVDLCFGDRFGDAATLKRVKEAANALVLKSHVSNLVAGGGNFDDDYVVRDNIAVCAVCRSKHRNTLLFPCRHLALCDSCAKQLADENCPICRQRITEKVLVFL